MRPEGETDRALRRASGRAEGGQPASLPTPAPSPSADPGEAAREARLKQLAAANQKKYDAQRKQAVQAAQSQPASPAANRVDDPRRRSTWQKRGWGGPRGEFSLRDPKTEAERRRHVLDDKPAHFETDASDSADEGPALWEIDELGALAIREHEVLIDETASKYAVDSDLVKAVMWVENSRGHKLGLNWLADAVGLSKSKMPMSIRSDLWGSLAPSDGDAGLRDPLSNVAAVARLMGALQQRIPNGDPSRVGTLWNSLSEDDVNDVGAAIGRLYREKPWRKTR